MSTKKRTDLEVFNDSCSINQAQLDKFNAWKSKMYHKHRKLEDKSAKVVFTFTGIGMGVTGKYGNFKIDLTDYSTW